MAVIDVVKWNAAPDEFIWKFPSDQLSTGTRLIVSAAQEALVVIGGNVSEPFQAGTHVLDTQNIPILRNLINIPFGGQTPYSAEVWFIQKTSPLNLLWGTQDPIPLLDPKFQVPIPVRCFGQFGVKIEDSKNFFLKLIGTHDIFNTAMLCDYFKGMVQTKIKSLVASRITALKCSVFEINQHLDELSNQITAEMAPDFAEFGVSLVNFYIQSINFPQDDPAVISLRESLAKRADMTILGYNYTQERSFDVLQGAAQNEGMAGTFAGAGIGLGLGTAVGGAIGPAVNQTTANIINTSAPSRNCISCNAPLSADMNFCPRCGAAQQLSCCGKVLPPDTNFCPVCGKRLKKSEE